MAWSHGRRETTLNPGCWPDVEPTADSTFGSSIVQASPNGHPPVTVELGKLSKAIDIAGDL